MSCKDFLNNLIHYLLQLCQACRDFITQNPVLQIPMVETIAKLLFIFASFYPYYEIGERSEDEVQKYHP
jgi:hypothetical protein